jgi:hypothetical protein
VTAAKEIRYFTEMGHTFEQSWTKIPPQDEDLLEINAIDKKNMEILIDDSWR